MTRFVAVAFFLTACASVSGAQSFAEHVAAGDEEHAAFRPARALAHYEAALAIDSGSAVVLGKASRSAVDLGEGEADRETQKALFRKGEALARRAVARDSLDAEAWFHLARALGRTALSVGVRERVRYAVEIRLCALRSLAIDPDHPGSLHVLGMWHAEIKRLSGLELFFARNFLGGGIFGQANWKEARSNMERAAALDPTRISHHLDLAGIYRDTGEREKARATYERVLQAAVQTDVNDELYKRSAEAALKRMR